MTLWRKRLNLILFLLALLSTFAIFYIESFDSFTQTAPVTVKNVQQFTPPSMKQTYKSCINHTKQNLNQSYYVFIDGEIFRLQRGSPKGISVVWKNLIPHLAKLFSGRSKLFFLDPEPDNEYSYQLSKYEGVNYIPRYGTLYDTIMSTLEANKVQNIASETLRDDGIIPVFISTYYYYEDLPDFCNVIMYHDLIPENVGMYHGPDSEYYPRIKLLDTISSVVAVSYSTSRDLIKWYGSRVLKQNKDPYFNNDCDSSFTRNTIITTAQNRISRDLYPGIASALQIQEFKDKFKVYTVDNPLFYSGNTSIDYLIMVGSSHEYKNQQFIFKALNLLDDKYLKKLTILLVGRGDLTDEEVQSMGDHPLYIKHDEDNERLISPQNDSNPSKAPIKIRILPFLDQKYLPIAYSGSIGLVYMSSYEGFGLPLAEALTSGTLALVSNSSSLPEVGGDAAFYVQNPKSPQLIKEGIVKLLSMSQKDRLQRIDLGRKYIEKFGGGGPGGIGHGWEEMATIIAQHIRGRKHRSDVCYSPRWSISKA